MKDIRIAFLDVDGTLSDMRTGKLSPEAMETLRQNGIMLCIATGRAPVFAPRLDGMEPDMWRTCSGSLCCNAQQITLSRPVPRGDVRRIIQNAAASARTASTATA